MATTTLPHRDPGRHDAAPPAGTTAEYTPHEMRERIFAILAASSGNLVEWFDFYIYAFCSIYFAHAFFPKGDPTTQLLQAAGVFAAGFLMRPIGGWVFGRIADRYGRKRSLVISVVMMCAGSLAIALTPTHATIGVMAPVVLTLARMVQGISVGGEYGTTATYMSEVALRGRRGFLSSFQYVTLIGGQLLAVLVVVILQGLLSDEELRAWGWRIPFVIGALTAVVALMLRRKLGETLSEESRAKKHAGTLRGLLQHKGAFLTVMGYTAGGSLAFYTFTTYMQKYLVNTAGFNARTASAVMTGALLVFMLLQPAIGALSYRIGRRTCLLVFGAVGALITVPLMLTLQGVDSAAEAFMLIAGALFVVSFYTSISALVKAEMFPPEVRALGVGFSYAIANAVFGGSAEYVALRFKQGGYEQGFYWYVTVMLVISFLFALRLPKQAAWLHHER
jgi:metabolite-proton symporter